MSLKDVLQGTVAKVAFGDEVNMFSHVHLRHYDQQGQGVYQYGSFIDRYGAPVDLEESWTDGFKSIEDHLLKHNIICANPHIFFPLVGAYTGGGHLYKPYHDQSPENWTGWIPRHQNNPSVVRTKKDGTAGEYSNRHLACVRGNEIQNDEWDLDPKTMVADDLAGPYGGGYWYPNNVQGRYLHIIALKTFHDQSKRYNYIVHPLAFRASLGLPDIGVDNIQWSVSNIEKEEHFNTTDKKWGDKVHGIELFNDFTYYFSWYGNYGIEHFNGTVREKDGKYQAAWYDTYPFEYCEFLLDGALSSGVYLQAMSANDAFYNTTMSYLDNKPGYYSETKASSTLAHDPKYKHQHEPTEYASNEARSKLKLGEDIGAALKKLIGQASDSDDSDADDFKKNATSFLVGRPYLWNTCFGYTAMLDVDGSLKKAIYPTIGKPDFDAGEEPIIDRMVGGQFYGHTGVYDIFSYDEQGVIIPFLVKGQTDATQLWYNDDMATFSMVYSFPRTKSARKEAHRAPWRGKLLWRYTVQYDSGDQTISSTGYFKLDDNKETKLDLSHYETFNVRWIRFTAFYYENPMKRAWFSPIRGANFKDTTKSSLSNRIAITLKSDDGTNNIYTDGGDEFTPTAVDAAANFTSFTFDSGNPDHKQDGEKITQMVANKIKTGKGSKPSQDQINKLKKYLLEKGNENCLHSYFMQVNSVLSDNVSSGQESNPRIMENVHGYFSLNYMFPTTLDLSNSWDGSTVKNDKVYFYKVDADTCQLKTMPLQA